MRVEDDPGRCRCGCNANGQARQKDPSGESVFRSGRVRHVVGALVQRHGGYDCRIQAAMDSRRKVGAFRSGKLRVFRGREGAPGPQFDAARDAGRRIRGRDSARRRDVPACTAVIPMPCLCRAPARKVPGERARERRTGRKSVAVAVKATAEPRGRGVAEPQSQGSRTAAKRGESGEQQSSKAAEQGNEEAGSRQLSTGGANRGRSAGPPTVRSSPSPWQPARTRVRSQKRRLPSLRGK